MQIKKKNTSVTFIPHPHNFEIIPAYMYESVLFTFSYADEEHLSKQAKCTHAHKYTIIIDIVLMSNITAIGFW